MRNRQEIEESYKEVVVPTGSETVYKLLFELLLDIRELLSKEHEVNLLDKVEEARIKEEDNRKKEIMDRISVK